MVQVCSSDEQRLPRMRRASSGNSASLYWVSQIQVAACLVHGRVAAPALGVFGQVADVHRQTVQARGWGHIPVRLTAARLMDAQGRVVGGIEAFQDISELKSLERERANIVSMFAHDMKSPLVNIQGFALRLLAEPVKRSQERRDCYLEVIAKEAGKLKALVNDFLDFSRLDIGTLKLNFSATDFDKELVELIELF